MPSCGSSLETRRAVGIDGARARRRAAEQPRQKLRGGAGGGCRGNEENCGTSACGDREELIVGHQAEILADNWRLAGLRWSPTPIKGAICARNLGSSPQWLCSHPFSFSA